ncbi:MAG: reverse transcriptase domain-containing protein [Candidatus Moranbacteria bacterium]|nr:reverse transcriptase domain-containing protein [Candidatus Moranbacteria bacterium]
MFLAWREFSSGKMKKSDVLEFEFNIEDNLFHLHRELADMTYQHSHYTAFNVCDPKLRRIHKACVKDRVLHHAVFRILYPIFDKSFVFDSYSCRIGKGTHRAVARLGKFCRKLGRNNTRNIFALKCDVRKFFDSVDQDILLGLINKKIPDGNAIWLVEKIIKSFEPGLPLGNVTSQLFANIYLNELDQFVKRELKEKYYLRYCDDFLTLNRDKGYLEKLIFPVREFLKKELKLELHPNKVSIRKYRQGVDFLGYVVLPNHTILRTKTKKRILRKIKEKRFLLREDLISEEKFGQSLQSYLGILTHCRGHNIKKQIGNITGFEL